MKKTLLAAALLAGFAGAAHAQSSVTLYGIVDVGIGGANRDGQDDSYGMVSGVQSGSRWGLRGSEDLGNGLRANFQLESGFDVGTGRSAQGGRLFGRASWGGLSGGWGEVRFGRQVTISSDYFAFTDPFGTGFQQGGAGYAFNGNSTNRADNTVAYFSPNFGGFTAAVGYSFNYSGGNEPSDDSNRLVSAGLKWANGPFAIAGTYEMATPGDNTAWNTAVDGEDPYNFQIGGTWDLQFLKAYAAYSRMKHGFTNTGLGDTDLTDPDSLAYGTIPYFAGGKVNAYLVGLSAPLGNGSLFGSWKMTDPDIDGIENNKQNNYSIGYTYDLSKRTNLYAFYSYADEAWYNDDWDSSQYAVGIRHRF